MFKLTISRSVFTLDGIILADVYKRAGKVPEGALWHQDAREGLRGVDFVEGLTGNAQGTNGGRQASTE